MAGLVLRPAPTLWVEWLILAPAWRPITGQHGVGRGLGLKVADRQGCRGCARPVKSARETGSSAWKKLGPGGKAGCALQAELRDFLFWSVGTVGNEVPCPAEVQKNLMIGYDGQFPSGLNERPIMWRSRLTMFRTSGLRVFLCSYVPMFWHYPALRIDIRRHGFRLGPI